ncbi:unnamed protein product [Staurois parvus]|uniref:Uncharacterized protein n=1 Tax=Staurois parvus TaxID=386267 RepID=A0ABN9G032_9NEOB|nr:unnamed protein product [Staurois parvus]
MLLPGGSRSVSWVPCTASHCCCLHRPQHSGHVATLSGLLTCWCCVPFCHRVCWLLQITGLPIAAAARPVICHGAPVPPPSCCCQVQPVSHGSLYGLPLLLSPSPHSCHCATFRSPHTAGVFHFVIGCWQITGLPLLLPGL